MFPPLLFDLELEASDHLHLARVKPVRQACDLSEAAASETITGTVEARAVECVEGLYPDLKLHVLADCELFAHRQIGIVDSLRKHIVQITRSVAELLIAWVGEAIGI